MEKSVRIDLLWEVFCDQLRTDWPTEYQLAFGDYRRYPDTNQSTTFAAAILSTAHKRKGFPLPKEDFPTAQTLHNCFRAGKPTIHTQNRTLDFLAAYAGYRTWTNFQSELRRPDRRALILKRINAASSGEGAGVASASPLSNAPTEEDPESVTASAERVTAEAATEQTPTPLAANSLDANAPGKKTSSNRKILVILFLAASLLLSGFYCYRIQQREAAEADIRTVIHGACRAEFIAYQRLPDTADTAFFAEYYTADSGNRREIAATMANSQKLRTHLGPRSNSDVMTIRVKEWLSNDRVLVATREKWLLSWYYADGTPYKKYDHVNEQTYLLEYDDALDRWLIRTNAYKGKAVPF